VADDWRGDANVPVSTIERVSPRDRHTVVIVVVQKSRCYKWGS
jgi:hypothetical protein